MACYQLEVIAAILGRQPANVETCCATRHRLING
jgi:hypothetical protein